MTASFSQKVENFFCDVLYDNHNHNHQPTLSSRSDHLPFHSTISSKFINKRKMATFVLSEGISNGIAFQSILEEAEDLSQDLDDFDADQELEHVPANIIGHTSAGDMIVELVCDGVTYRKIITKSDTDAFVSTDDDDSWDLETKLKPEEITKIDIFTEDQCVICYSASPSVAFVPCGHQCLCTSCESEFSVKSENSCPVCRKLIYNILDEPLVQNLLQKNRKSRRVSFALPLFTTA